MDFFLNFNGEDGKLVALRPDHATILVADERLPKDTTIITPFNIKLNVSHDIQFVKDAINRFELGKVTALGNAQRDIQELKKELEDAYAGLRYMKNELDAAKRNFKRPNPVPDLPVNGPEQDAEC